MLPTESRRQWIGKVAVAMALTLVLGFGLPLLLFYVAPSSPYMRLVLQSTSFPLLLCVVALYLSSAASSGMRAMMALV